MYAAKFFVCDSVAPWTSSKVLLELRTSCMDTCCKHSSSTNNSIDWLSRQVNLNTRNLRAIHNRKNIRSFHWYINYAWRNCGIGIRDFNKIICWLNHLRLLVYSWGWKYSYCQGLQVFRPACLMKTHSTIQVILDLFSIFCDWKWHSWVNSSFNCWAIAIISIDKRSLTRRAQMESPTHKKSEFFLHEYRQWS